MRENKQQISFHKLLCNYLVYTRRCAHISIPRYTILSAIPYDRERKYSFDLSFYFSFYFRQRIALYSNLYSLYFSLPMRAIAVESALFCFVRFDSKDRIEGVEYGKEERALSLHAFLGEGGKYAKEHRGRCIPRRKEGGVFSQCRTIATPLLSNVTGTTREHFFPASERRKNSRKERKNGSPAFHPRFKTTREKEEEDTSFESRSSFLPFFFSPRSRLEKIRFDSIANEKRNALERERERKRVSTLDIHREKGKMDRKR